MLRIIFPPVFYGLSVRCSMGEPCRESLPGKRLARYECIVSVFRMAATILPGRWFGIFVILCGAVLVCRTASADRGVDTTSSDHPLIPAVYAKKPPALDGVLDDPVWAYATRLDKFYCTDLNRAPSESTIVWLAYDSTNMYFAARCYDHHPDQVRMEQTKRSNDLWTDDYLAIELDIEHQHRYDGAYAFRVNPRGTQDEYIPDGSASKIEWRGDWEAVARIDSLSWVAEFSVPLAIFNRPAGNHTVGISLYRQLQRTKEGMQWPNMGANWDRTKTGDWMGIAWPKRRQRPIFMPYVVGHFSRTTDEEEDPPVKKTAKDAYLGLDMKYTTPHGLAVVGTVYPDFQNVESDILGLDFSYSERYRDDRRPFFEEGEHYFPKSWIFYSNRVEEIYGGGKLFGQLGKHRLGLINAYGRDRVNHVAGTWYWQPITRFETESNFAWRHGPKDAPREDGMPMATDNVVAVTVISKSRQVGNSTEYYSAQGGFTHTASDTGDGYDAEAGYDRHGGNGSLDLHMRVRHISAGFTPIDGLLDLDERNQRDATISVGYWLEKDRRWFREWGLDGYARYAERLNGDLYTRILEGSGWIEVFSGAGIYGELRDGERPPYHDRTLSAWFWWNDDKLYTSGELGSTVGRVEDADYLLVSLSQGVRPWDVLSFQVRTQYRRRNLPVGHEDKPEGGIEQQYQIMSTAQYDITTERAVSGRLIYSHEGLNGYCTYRQVVRRGLDLFLILGDPSADTWTPRIALKAMIVI